jgi:hypothetical protein
MKAYEFDAMNSPQPHAVRRVVARQSEWDRRQDARPVPQAVATHPLLQLQHLYGNHYVQRVVALARKGAGETTAAPEVETAIDSARGGGHTLDGGVRRHMESALGADFSGVRVHTDTRADMLNRAVSARAFTTGQDIFFREGEYRPGGSSGRELLAHELTHVLQQSGRVRHKLTLGAPDDEREREADEVARVLTLRSSMSTHSIPHLQHTIGNPVVLNVLRSQEHRLQRADSFTSSGYGVTRAASQTETITRPEQVLDEYGMTCYGTSIMFMLQSYGLVPPNMTREEFEYAFTPLNPGGNHTAAKKVNIKVAGKEQPGAMPVDLITKALEGVAIPKKIRTSIGNLTATEATLRGADWGGLGVADIMKHMPAILAAFRAQAGEKGYEFMKTHVPLSKESYIPGKLEEEWVDGSALLEAGTIGADYFKQGNTILAGVDYNYPPGQSPQHWVVIVRDKVETRTIASRQHHLYPADDPLWGQVYVMAPLLGSVDSAVLNAANLRQENAYLTFSGRQVHMLMRGNAYRRKQVK